MLVFCAIDTQDLNYAQDLVRQVAPVTGAIKLGLEFFNTFGPQGVESILNIAPDINLFLDLKFHDIPNTVYGAVNTISKAFSPCFLNVHAGGGYDMMRRAQDAVHDPSKTELLSVTILTSFDAQGLKRIGYEKPAQDHVVQLAKLTQDAGLSGVVCSAHEIAAVRHACGDGFKLMVPGIRPSGSEAGDQKRVMTPKQAQDVGATHLVIGRPITQAKNPAKAASEILETLRS